MSFRLDRNVPDHIANGRDYATILCVKGANGSGKTHLLKGIAFIASFAARSFSADPEAEIPVDPYFKSDKPCEFYAEFSAGNGLNYLYELSLTKERVEREVLYEKKNRKTKLFEREGEKVVAIKRLSEIESIIYRKNASTISTLHQHGNTELKPVHDFFSRILFNVTQAGFTGGRAFDMNAASKFFLENPSSLVSVKEFIKECDIGITNITIASEEGQDGKKNSFPIFHHIVEDQELPVYPLTESSGTKYLYRMLLSYFITIAQGGVFVADEFDIYLHPDILPKILALFTNESANTTGAQLLFSAHDVDVLDICGKYRTHLVNKDNNASYTYRLDEIPGDVLRNDRPISTPYKEGRIGGVPRV
ncbi:MAG: ATP-binding protein [Rhodoferax sp.]|nr:ATP-binding protein [Rhodoferax sp.]